MKDKIFIVRNKKVAFRIISKINDLSYVYEVEWLSIDSNFNYLTETNNISTYLLESKCVEVKDGNWKLALITQELKND